MMRDWEKDWEMCQKASSGPWRIREVDNDIEDYKICTVKPTQFHDAEFIAEAREALPYWLERVRELEEENNKLWEIANAVRGYMEMVRNFIDGLQCDRNMKDSLDYFYKGAKAVEQAGVELEKMLEESEDEGK